MNDVTTTAQRWQRVKTILADALEHPSPEDRTAYLERSCEGDTTLMREVEALLAQSTRSLDELADKTPVGFGHNSPAQPIGQRIGAYEILREIGRGGMGAVYLAKRADGQFEKEVAIKLLKRGTDTDEILRRFQAERRILARLDHPNIARLLDAGTTDDGLPYFVMEYIGGLPITRYVRDEQLPIAGRLQLFLKVCAAVHFAHQNLVVHRDLKPSNILVAQKGEPKLLDFGIAKLLGPTEDGVQLTLTAERRFTPVCASPEQARGEPVTTASDVYALGALLYELLTDQPPHRFSSPHPSMEELARVIGEQEPALPSSTSPEKEAHRRLRGDLDNITLLALRKEPARRYASVSDFAEDIRRHLENRPVHARPHTAGYLTRRFLGRHKLGVTVAVVAVLAAMAVGGILIWQTGQAAERSASLRADVKSSLSDFQTHWRAGNPTAGLDDIQRGLVALKALAAANPKDRQLEEAEGYAYECQAIAQRALGDVTGAANSYAQAEAVYTMLAAQDPSNSNYLELLRTTKQEHAKVNSVNPSAAN
jgi:eukaryotic-like serine/threonine-protein kinase